MQRDEGGTDKRILFVRERIQEVGQWEVSLEKHWTSGGTDKLSSLVRGTKREIGS
jgi:hypothetical protein